MSKIIPLKPKDRQQEFDWQHISVPVYKVLLEIKRDGSNVVDLGKRRGGKK